MAHVNMRHQRGLASRKTSTTRVRHESYSSCTRIAPVFRFSQSCKERYGFVRGVTSFYHGYGTARRTN